MPVFVWVCICVFLEWIFRNRNSEAKHKTCFMQKTANQSSPSNVPHHTPASSSEGFRHLRGCQSLGARVPSPGAIGQNCRGPGSEPLQRLYMYRPPPARQSSCTSASRGGGHAHLPFAKMPLLGVQEGRGTGWGGSSPPSVLCKAPAHLRMYCLKISS